MKAITKIHLSAEEALLVDNTEWILTKNRIIKKIYVMFGEIHEIMMQELASLAYLFGDKLPHGGKISRGENYRLLPYIILDYPSYFGKENIFAVRTMFWWGNFFSITLHLSGEPKAKFLNYHPDLIELLRRKNFFICVNSEEWEHHFEENNYLPAADMDSSLFEQVTRKPFLKIAKKISVKEWGNASVFIMNGFKEIVELLQINFQGGKTGLLPVFPITGSDP